MKKFSALLTKENGLRMNGKMVTLTFVELCTVYIKNYGNSFSEYEYEYGYLDRWYIKLTLFKRF